MGAVKPARSHPWRKAIKTHVDEASLRRELHDINEQIKRLRDLAKEKKARLDELKGSQ